MASSTKPMIEVDENGAIHVAILAPSEPRHDWSVDERSRLRELVVERLTAMSGSTFTVASAMASVRAVQMCEAEVLAGRWTVESIQREMTAAVEADPPRSRWFDDGEEQYPGRRVAEVGYFTLWLIDDGMWAIDHECGVCLVEVV